MKKISTHKLKAQIFTERWYILCRFQIQHNLPKYLGGNEFQTYFYTIMPKKAKRLPCNFHGWAFCKIVKFVLTKKGLPITYHNFRNKSLVRLKGKSPNWQGSQPISYKTKFSQRDNIYLADLEYKITYQNIREKTKVRPKFSCPEKSKMTNILSNNLHRWAFYKMVKFVLRKNVYQ